MPIAASLGGSMAGSERGGTSVAATSMRGATSVAATSRRGATSAAATSVAEKIDAKEEKVDEVKNEAAGKAAAKLEANGEEIEIEDDDDLPEEARPVFERNELPSSGPKYREDAVHIYGLDFLRTEHMNEIFSQFQHRFIEWINDSSANIVFRSKESAKKALESLSYPKARDPPWRRTPDILVNDDCPPIFLQMRLATADDVKKGKKSAPSVFKGDSKVANRARASQRAGQGNVYRDGMTTELLVQAGLLGKRGKPEEPPSAEELAKRLKRKEKFGGTEETAIATSTTTADAGTSTTTADAETALADAMNTELGSRRKPLPPPSQEESAKRQKRSERFVDGSGAIATSGMAAGGGKAATSETAANGDTAANGGKAATSEKADTTANDGTAASGDTQKAAAVAMK